MIQYKYCFISIAVHFIILLLFFCYIDPLNKPLKYGNQQAQALSAFIYQGNFARSQSIQEKVKIVKKTKSSIFKTTSPQALKLKREKDISPNENEITQKNSNESSVSQGEFSNALIALLHDAIQRKQHYPASAWEMQRQGRVTVAFYLYEDGHVANTRVLISSGTSSLDNAAIQAVNEAAPFDNLTSYIKKPQEYQIDIVFELT